MKLLSLLALATAAASAFAASQPDLNAFYQFGWAGRADNDQGRQITSVQLVQVNNTEVDVYGLFHELSARAIYDADEMSLTFLQQQLLPADEWNGKALWLYTEVFELSNGELKNEHAVPYIKFYYQPTGVKMDEGLREFVGGWLPESNYYQFEINDEGAALSGRGYNEGWKYALYFRNIDEAWPAAGNFRFDESQWMPIGNARLTDGWYKALDGVGYDAYDVPAYQSRSDANQILLRKPYGSGTPYGVVNDTPEAEGYILLDISDPGCVVVRPNISNGFVSEYELEMTCNMTSTTDEGMLYYIEGKTKEEIKEKYSHEGKTVSTMDSRELIRLPNCRYQNGYNLPRALQWISSYNKQPIPMETEIQLPDRSAVISVGAEPGAPDTTTCRGSRWPSRRAPGPSSK